MPAETRGWSAFQRPDLLTVLFCRMSSRYLHGPELVLSLLTCSAVVPLEEHRPCSAPGGCQAGGEPGEALKFTRMSTVG